MIHFEFSPQQVGLLLSSREVRISALEVISAPECHRLARRYICSSQYYSKLYYPEREAGLASRPQRAPLLYNHRVAWAKTLEMVSLDLGKYWLSYQLTVLRWSPVGWHKSPPWGDAAEVLATFH